MDISSLSLANLSLQRPDPSQMRAQLFKKTDADGSGTITKQELTDALASRPQRPGGAGGEAPDVDAMFSKMDTDGNGEVTEAEHTAFLETTDAERDGQRPPPPPPGGRGFDGSTDMLSSLLSALQNEDGSDTSTDVSALIKKLVESLKERSSSYTADGSTAASSTRSLFETGA